MLVHKYLCMWVHMNIETTKGKGKESEVLRFQEMTSLREMASVILCSSDRCIYRELEQIKLWGAFRE